MAELPYMQFFPSDWMADCQVLSLAGRGAWQTIICKAWHPTTRGVVTLTLPAWARLFGATPSLAAKVIAELEETKVADVTREGDAVTVTCRRAVREWNKRTEEQKKLSESGKRGAEKRWGKDSPPNSPPIGQPIERPMAIQNPEARGQNPEERETPPVAPPPEPPKTPKASPPALSGGAQVLDVLRKHAGFVAAWRDWETHLAEKEKAMTRMQRDSVLMDCARAKPDRSVEVIEFSIKKGAHNLIWDAPKAKRKPDERPILEDPPEWKRWLEETYPTADPTPYQNAMPAIQIEFQQWKKGRK